MKDLRVDQVIAVLTAFPSEVINTALAALGRSRRNNLKSIEEISWKEWTGDGIPGKPFEWTELNGVIYYRNVPEIQSENIQKDEQSLARTKSRSKTEDAKICPDCGAQAFAQQVCPKCSKGKAGIKKQWVCGDNSDHVFFTE